MQNLIPEPEEPMSPWKRSIDKIADGALYTLGGIVVIMGYGAVRTVLDFIASLFKS